MDKEKRLLAFLVVLLATSNFYWSFRATFKPEVIPASSGLYNSSDLIEPDQIVDLTTYQVPETNVSFSLSNEFEVLPKAVDANLSFKGPNTVQLDTRTEEIVNGNYSAGWKYVGNVKYRIEGGWTLDPSEVITEERAQYQSDFEGMTYPNDAIRLDVGDAGAVQHTLYIPDLVNNKMVIISLSQAIGGDALDNYPEYTTELEPYDYDQVFNSVTISE
jgi:hypothetical protein